MPTKKQIRRQQKLKRHEYEEVYVDEEGRELDPAEAEELIGATVAAKAAKAAKKQPARPRASHDRATVLRRTLKRGLLFFPLMLVTVILLGKTLTLAQQITQTVVLMAFFLPFSYFMDTMMFRSYQRRLDARAGRGQEEELGRGAAVVALAGPRREQQQDPGAVRRSRASAARRDRSGRASPGRVDRLAAARRSSRALRARSPRRFPSPGGRPSPARG